MQLLKSRYEKQNPFQFRQLELFKDRKATTVAQTLASHHLPANRARELITPSTESANLRIEIEEKFFRLWFLDSLCVTSQWEQVCAFLTSLLGHGRQPNANVFSLNFFLDLRLENVSLEPLIDLLQHLDGKLWLKNPVFGKNLKFSKKLRLATSVQLWPLVIGSQIELESYSNPLKTREVFYVRFKKKTFRIFSAFSVHGPMIGECFANILMMLSADPPRGYCGSKFYWIPDSNTRF